MTKIDLKILKNQAKIPKTYYPLKAWFNTCIELIKCANNCQFKGDKIQSYILWLKAAGVADIINNHDQYLNLKNSYNDSFYNQITNFLTLNVPIIIDNANKLEFELNSSSYFDDDGDVVDSVGNGVDDINIDQVSKQFPQIDLNYDSHNWEVIPPPIPSPQSHQPRNTYNKLDLISPHKLFKYLSSTTLGDLSILLLDCRPLISYKLLRINLNPPGGKGRSSVVWIDPNSLINPLNIQQLESIIKSSSNRGYNVFLNRHIFDYVIIFDNDCSLTPPNNKLNNLVNALDDHNLKHTPLGG